MEKCTRAMGWVVLLLFLTLIIAVIPTDGDAEIYADTLRLHILANSDEQFDQELKLSVRDKILEKYGSILSRSASIEEAEQIAREHTSDIKEDVDTWVREAGYNYESEIVIGREWYDTREYENFTLPAGYYTSMRVLLGEGEGKNWWCVMYPPLCLDAATEPIRSGYTVNEETLISGKYVVKFKILEMLSASFK